MSVRILLCLTFPCWENSRDRMSMPIYTLWILFQKKQDKQLGFIESILTRSSTQGRRIKSTEVWHLYISIVIHFSSASQLDLILVTVNETTARATSKPVLSFEALVLVLVAVTMQDKNLAPHTAFLREVNLTQTTFCPREMEKRTDMTKEFFTRPSLIWFMMVIHSPSLSGQEKHISFIFSQ